jgi:hypothetical protein
MDLVLLMQMLILALLLALKMPLKLDPRSYPNHRY